MVDMERVKKSVFKAIDEANEQLSAHEQLAKDPQTVLLGVNSGLDSLGSVIFFSAVEEKIEEEFGAKINIMDERAAADKDETFGTVGRLMEHICAILNEGAKG